MFCAENMSLILFKRLLFNRSAACIKTTWWNSMHEITMKNHLPLNLQFLHTLKPKIRGFPFQKLKPKMARQAFHWSGCVRWSSYFENKVYRKHLSRKSCSALCILPWENEAKVNFLPKLPIVLIERTFGCISEICRPVWLMFSIWSRDWRIYVFCCPS